MANSIAESPRSEISSLKEALCLQQKLLQKLSNELDAEREASASAASEALSVILRLQGEKAAVKMEAEQYKRLAEEKICHAEESFAIIEDIITQKEMEVASLEYQVQKYRYTLSTMGCADFGGDEFTYQETVLLVNEHLARDTGVLGRRNSAPAFDKYMKLVNEKENGVDASCIAVEGEKDQEAEDSTSDCCDGFSSHEGFTSYGDEIRKLDTRIKEIAGDNYTSFLNKNRNEKMPGSKKVASSVRSNSSGDQSSDPKFHDVFEVPDVDQESTSCGLSAKMQVSRLKRPLFRIDEKNLCKPDVIELQGLGTSTSTDEETSMLNRVKEQLSLIRDIIVGGQDFNKQEEQELLREIKDIANLLENEIQNCWSSQRSLRQHDPLHCLLQEAMLSFWL